MKLLIANALEVGCVRKGEKKTSRHEMSCFGTQLLVATNLKQWARYPKLAKFQMNGWKSDGNSLGKMPLCALLATRSCPPGQQPLA